MFDDKDEDLEEAEEEEEEEEETEEEKEEKKERKNYFSGFFTGILLCALIAVAVLVVAKIVSNKKTIDINEQAVQAQENRNDNVFAGIGATPSPSAAPGNEYAIDEQTYMKLIGLENLIDQYYYLETDKEALRDGVYKGIIDAIDDPYSTYYTEKELATMLESSKGSYYGIGAYIGNDKTTGYAYFSSVMKNTPAEQCGIKGGDLITAINGEDAAGFDSAMAASLIKGPEGTNVVITVARPGENGYEYIDIEITRQKIDIDTVEYTMLDNGIAHIWIYEFDDITLEQFRAFLQQAKDENMKGLILDLRDNPGGNLDICVDIAREILPKGLVVYTEDKYGNREEYTCDGSKELNVPIVVLVNGNSASASEILTGAIKDCNKGTVVGTTTFGKGIVQRILQLTDGSAVKLTVSKYYTPNGVNIHGEGIAPDIEIELDADAYLEDGTDNQLDKAIEVISGMM